MKRENVKLELIEPYFDTKTPNSIASMVGGKVVTMMPSVGGKPEITDYFKLFDYDIALLTQAFQQTQ
jgi:ABC-type Zn uptake system ZnuABC Zn-binding protein ZnuA